MTLKQRKEKLIEQITSLDDDQLTMLEQEISFFTQSAQKDIVDDLSPDQLKELISLVNEPAEVNVISETDYKNATSRWRSK
ncbi:MAG TPA: hypothetical protein VLZ28_05320 [Daejeonella sp.]|nr:hypothetical protein [Daejeonella sp.]